ncbi:MAG: hypothetical protein O2990_07890 [Bacteroidetes bacterium]|nr:hypothetical protein [Bacteroidota bacterium]
MKHLITLVALLTSLSAIAQLPYNPDANNDGHIGAVDLTSLLSVYSNNFSNGVLSEGTSILVPNFNYYDSENYPTLQYGEAYFNWDGSTSFVIDLSFAAWNPENSLVTNWQFWLSSQNQDWINGTTMTAIIPDGWFNYLFVDEVPLALDFETGLPQVNRFFKWVYWNGNWYRNF